jgi:hypothetical protein
MMNAPEHVERTRLQRWVIGSGTVVAVVSAVVALTTGGTPDRAMQAPFGPAPTATSQARANPATCTTPAP